MSLYFSRQDRASIHSAPLTHSGSALALAARAALSVLLTPLTAWQSLADLILKSGRAAGNPANGFARRHVWAEHLETRLCFSTFTVTNTNDSGVGSLRQAVDAANFTPAVPDT